MSTYSMSMSPETSPEIDSPSRKIYELECALRKEQIEKNHYKNENTLKDKELADITNENVNTGAVGPIDDPRLHRKSKNIYLVNMEQRVEVQQKARKFTYMNLFWLRPSDTRIFTLDVNPDYCPRNRYLSVEEQQQGILAELCTEIPKKWHNDMGNPAFLNQFLHEMGQQRSNASHRMHQAGPWILDCSNNVFHDDKQRSSMFQELIGFVVNEGVQSYKALAPILYQEDPNQTDLKWRIFRHPMLMKTYSALVRGTNSIKGLSGEQVTKVTDYHATCESKWGLKAITPGAIAMCSILIRFIASGDRLLQPRGSQTGINYQEDYEFYLKYLHKGLNEEIPSVMDIFKTWNQLFYPKSLEGSTNVGQNTPEDLDNLLNELEAEGVEAQRALQLNEEQTLVASEPVHADENDTTKLRMYAPEINLPRSESPMITSDIRSHQSSSSLTELDEQTNSGYHKVSQKKNKGRQKAIRKAKPAKKRNVAQIIESEELSDKENLAPRPTKRTRHSRRLKNY